MSVSVLSHGSLAVVASRASCAHQCQKMLGGSVDPLRSSKNHGHRRLRLQKTTTAAAATGAVEVSTHRVPSGLELEVLSQKAATSAAKEKPPLVFVHGSYHAAWCWSEHFFQFFADRGHDVFAISLRGQGGSDVPSGGANTLEEHAEDISHFCATRDRPPVLVGHSFGGLVVQKVLCQPSPPELAGLALLASVPPSGNSDMVKRFLKKDLWASVKITYAFIAGAFKSNSKLCRECFFSEDLPEAGVALWVVRLLDLKALDASLPISPPRAGSPPVCVVGGKDDFVVDVEGLEETAAWAGAAGGAVVLEGTAHDVMLDTRWEGAAAALEGWMVETGVV